MQKIIFICLVALIGVFYYQLKLGLGGEHDNKRIHSQISTQQHINIDLERRNNGLTTKIIGLKGSVDFLEARSRQELNLVKPNETLVLLPGHAGTVGTVKKS